MKASDQLERFRGPAPVSRAQAKGHSPVPGVLTANSEVINSTGNSSAGQEPAQAPLPAKARCRCQGPEGSSLGSQGASAKCQAQDTKNRPDMVLCPQEASCVGPMCQRYDRRRTRVWRENNLVGWRGSQGALYKA